MSIILKAILYLAPHLATGDAALYARLIDHEANHWGVHPLLVVAAIEKESNWRPRVEGPTSDFGLLQVRVSKTNYPELLGHEYLLYDPALNIHLGVKLMSFWRNWHYSRCQVHHHPWWSHLKWGFKVKDGGRSGRERIGKVYEKLLKRFGGLDQPDDSV
jgi:hypothetical protein